MLRPPSSRDWLPLAKADAHAGELPTGEAFRREWIDFHRGIRVGNLEPHERITQILKFHLETRHGTQFVTDRWGRGVYWQWICWLPRANREAKPVSHDVNFGCAKFFISVSEMPKQLQESGSARSFISVEQEKKIFKAGLQIERGYAQGPEPHPGCLKSDWDWHRLVKFPEPLDAELRRLIKREGFFAEIGEWETNSVFTKRNFKSSRQIRAVLENYPRRKWVGFQLYYPMPEREVCACSGYELVKAICGVFDEVKPAMNCCMTVPLVAESS